jgi:hypothetical protein
VEEIVDYKTDTKGRPNLFEVVWWWDPKLKQRPANSWIPKSNFKNFNSFKDNMDILKRWKQSKYADKKEFFRHDSEGKAFYDLKKNLGADEDGWCSFRAAVIALEMVTGRFLKVSDSMIEDFQSAGVKRNPYRDELKYGTKWSETKVFIMWLCGKKMFKIKLDFTVLAKNRDQNGVGIDALARCKLEPGIYMLAGFDRGRNSGHCVVLEVHDHSVTVHEHDIEGGVENLDWLHEISYVRRFKLLEEDKPRSKL